MIVSFMNQKGGVGKTTLALNVAGELARMRRRVLLIDADPQGSSLNWAAARQSTPPFTVVGQPTPTIHRDISELSKGFDNVVIDGAPSVAELARSIVQASDLVVIPVQPSPYDVWAADESVALVKEAQVFRPELMAVFAINRRIVGTAIGRDLKKTLDQFGLPVFASEIFQRVVFAESAKDGRLVAEHDPHSPACEELAELAAEIVEAAA